MDDYGNDDYKVGYQNPPCHSQFKKGQSGNPRGRPKKEPMTIHDQVFAELKKIVPVVENGKKCEITKLQALAANFINNAAKGDHKALRLLFRNFPLY